MSVYMNSKYPEVIILPKISVTSLHKHEYSSKALPKQTSDMTPIQCEGDGNCLFRYVNHSH